MQINLREHVGMHNKYTFELRDAATGKIKQKAFAENVVLDTLWTRVFANTGRNALLFGVSMGDGEGDPSASDTGLFNKVFDYRGTFSQVSIAESYPTCTYVYKIDIPASESYVGELSEVGLRSSAVYLANYVMWTHALLADSEGNPIIIDKTDLDILTITVTLYVTFGSSNHFHWATPGVSNPICRYFRAAHQSNYSPFISGDTYLAHCATCLLDDDECVTQVTSTSGTRVGTGTYDGANKLYGVTTKRLGTAAGNTGYFNGLCLYSYTYGAYMGGIVYPEPSIFPNQTLSGMSVGTGDGSTTHFNLPIEFFVENTDVVKVDGVALTRGVDYLIDNVAELNTYADAMNISNFLIPVSGYTISEEYSKEYLTNFIAGKDRANYTLPFSHYCVDDQLAATLKSHEPIIYRVADEAPCKMIKDIIVRNLAICGYGEPYTYSSSRVAVVGVNDSYVRFYDDRPTKTIPTVHAEVTGIDAAAMLAASMVANDPTDFLVETTRGTLIAKYKLDNGSVTRIIHPLNEPMYYANITNDATGLTYFVWVGTTNYRPYMYLCAPINGHKSVTVDGVTWYAHAIAITPTSFVTEPCFCVCRLNGDATFYEGCKLVIAGGASKNGPWTTLMSYALDEISSIACTSSYVYAYGVPDACCSVPTASYDYYSVKLDISDATSIELLDDSVPTFVHIQTQTINSDLNNEAYVSTLALGYSDGGITFMEPPAEGAVITLDADIDRPYKNENFVIDASMILQF